MMYDINVSQAGALPAVYVIISKIPAAVNTKKNASGT